MSARRVVYGTALLGALLCVLIIAGVARSRISAGYAAANASQEATLQRVRGTAGDFFTESAELLRDGGAVATRVSGNTRLVESLLAGVLQERQNRSIHGMGFFYAPFAFAPGMKLYGPYIKVTNQGLSLIRNTSERDYDYPKLTWYRRAVQAHGDRVVIGPYREANTRFISTIAAFSVQGRLRGVATVDAQEEQFTRSLAHQLQPGQIAFISGPREIFVKTSALPQNRSDWMEAQAAVPMTGATLHLLTNVAALRRETARIVVLAIVASLAAIAACVLFAVTYRRWRKAQASAQQFQQELRTRAQVEATLRKAAFTDELTGLPNRPALRARIAEALAAGERLAIYLLDFDRFNVVNETFGHAAGDELLKLAGARLHDADVGTAVRIGGDEFVVLVDGERAAEDASQRLLEIFATPFALGTAEYHLTASIGAVLPGGGYASADDYLRDADIALYEAKRAGRARAVRFDLPMRERVQREVSLEVDIHRALRDQQFVPYYQPIVDARTRAVDSFEILARWVSPERGTLAAEEFIGFAEQRGFVAQIDMMMLSLAAREAPLLFQRFPGASIAINISSAHLSDERLVPAIAAALRSANIPPHRLQLEITETAVMRNAERARSVLQKLRDLGVQTVVDDFGVGQSSLAYLQHLPITGLKIDRSFIAELGESEQARAIVRAIVALGASLRLKVVAEGIETEAQAQAAAEIGVAYLQGYLFARPAPAHALLPAAS